MVYFQTLVTTEMINKVHDINTFIMDPSELRCPEYSHRLDMNPFQHPSMDKNIHSLLEVVTDLCNRSGGIIYLSLEDPEAQVTSDMIETFQSRLKELIECKTKLLLEKEVNFMDLPPSVGIQKAWSAIHVKKSKREYLGDDMVYSGTFGAEGGTPILQSETASSMSSDDFTSCLDDFSSVKVLEWSKNKDSWENNVHVEILRISKIVDSCSLWKPTKPMTVTPDRKKLQEWFPAVEDMNETLLEVNTNMREDPGFAVACKTWMFHVSNCQTEIRPPGHICDILTVTNKGKMCLWAICIDQNGRNIDRQMEYLLTTGRMIKERLLNQPGDEDLSNICIKCHLFFPGNTSTEGCAAVRSALGELEMMQCQILRVCGDEVNFESLQRAIAMLILSKESPLKRPVGEQTAITLSKEQLEVLFNNKRVNYVSGPAGSGKSYTAAFLYRQYGRSNSVYISTTLEFVRYLEFSGYEGTLIRTDQDLLREIRNDTFKNKTCIIIDDSHNFACSKRSVKKIFALMKKNKEMSLYVFADNEYQSFDKKRQEAMRDCIRELSQEVLEIEPHYAYLTTIYRNTKKVVSFVQTVIKESYEGHEKINCGNVETGDGVECIKMKEMDELADYLKVCIRKQYRWSDIAVLLHPSYTDGQIEKCRNILIELLPGSNANYASVFPREGVVVDSVSRFLGLDAPLCIYILPQNLQRQNPNQPIAPLFQKLFKREHPKPDVSIYNPRFKVFMASRATHKAVFVVPEINAELVKQMHFDKFEVGGVFITARNSLL